MSATRARLLSAAATVLRTEGARSFTLATVAAAAGVSKGGLLYHFPSKQALVSALIEQLTGLFDVALEQAGTEPGAATRAYLNETLAPMQKTAGAETAHTTVALLAAALVEPDLLRGLRQTFAAWQHRLENDGIDPAVATAVRLAADGWWLADLLQLSPPAAGLHQRTRDVLAGLIERGQ